MSTEDNKRAIRDSFESFNDKDESTFGTYIHPDYQQHYPPEPKPGMGGVQEMIEAFKTSFPDYSFTIEEQVAEGDLVAARYTFRGTHLGEFLGHPPTGRSVELCFLDIQRVKDGKVIDNWWTADQLDALTQLGLAPAGARPWGWLHEPRGDVS